MFFILFENYYGGAMIKAVLSGFMFGMILQISVGPICFYVFNQALENGFIHSFKALLAVVMVDFFYIILAIIGLGKVLQKKRWRKWIKNIGGVVLIVFAVQLVLNIFNISIIPFFQFKNISDSSFWTGFFLTLSNPLTIVFWSGVFSIKIIEKKYQQKELIIFSTGAIVATLLFLMAIALLGLAFSQFLSPLIIKILNMIVVIILFYFGLKLILEKIEEK